MSKSGSVSNAKKAGKFAPWFKEYKSSLSYAKYVITHPFDGFWDLVHEKRGSMAAAHTFLIMFMITYICKLMFTNFQFNSLNLKRINLFQQCGSLLLIFLILCLANWAMTTLFDGKGKFKDIYMAMCYALVPFTLLQLPLVLVSHIVTFEESSFYTVLMTVSIIWCLGLAFVGLMEVHDYGPGKTILFLIVTLLGACIIIFLILVFFSLLSDAIGFFVSLYREIAFRFY